jgi:hypothetical protein
MSKETLDTNLVQSTGLTPVQNQEVVELRANVTDADERLQLTLSRQENNERQNEKDRAMGNYHMDPASVVGLTSVIESTVNVGERAWDKRGLNKAKQKASNHFRKHEAAYVEQAEKDAVAEGVDLNR